MILHENVLPYRTPVQVMDLETFLNHPDLQEDKYGKYIQYNEPDPNGYGYGGWALREHAVRELSNKIGVIIGISANPKRNRPYYTLLVEGNTYSHFEDWMLTVITEAE